MNEYRSQFPILKQKVRGFDLHYLDSAATCLKPSCVLDAVAEYYNEHTSNVHRGTYKFSAVATKKYEEVREKVQAFIGAQSKEEIIFTKGTTESINLVAQSFGSMVLDENSEILLSTMEHHSNIVPWQLISEKTGAKIKVLPIDESGSISLDDVEKMLSDRTKIVGITHVSNALGTVNDVKKITDLAHNYGAKVVVDGAQAVAHLPVNVGELGCDFYAFSAHKMYGPTGVGVLYGKKELLNSMPPFLGGGDMILSVSFEKTTYARVPYKFEAGTPNISGVLGFGAAIDFLTKVGFEKIEKHEDELLQYATQKLSRIPKLKMIGTAPNKKAILSFIIEGIHPHDISTIVDCKGVAIRAGHLCAQPVMAAYKIPSLSRASLGIYSNEEDIDALCSALGKAVEMF